MKVAVVGSRSLQINDLEKFLPKGATEIVSGGAKGIDRCARRYALKNHLPLTEFLPEYDKYKKGAPLKRNLQIIDYADMVLVFWDGTSSGTKYIIDCCEEKHKPIRVVIRSE